MNTWCVRVLSACCLLTTVAQAQNLTNAAEYLHAGTGIYVVTPSAYEQAQYAKSASGWNSTGNSFPVWLTPYAADNLQPVCRFTGSNGNTTTRYYTLDSAFCSSLRSLSGVSYEGVAFYARPPTAGACAAGDTPIYAAWNGRDLAAGMSFRYLADATAYAALATQGWNLLGTAFCGPNLTAADSRKTEYLTFSINVQDFAYPELSIATVRRVMTLHETYKVPVDIYLTEHMIDIYEQQAPDILEKMRSSPYVAGQYHIRPPKPYYNNYDWAGLTNLSAADQYQQIYHYESHGIDLATGQPTSASGGLAKLANVLGNAAFIGSFSADDRFGTTVNQVFYDLGAKMTVRHGTITNLGDAIGKLYLRPEHYDLLLFQQGGQDAATLIAAAMAAGKTTTGARAPYFVGVKMHDNDFFAQASAWTTVFVDTKRPPWDISKKAALKSETEQQAMWTIYEAAVAYAAQNSATTGTVNGYGIKAMFTASSSLAPK